MSDVKGRENFFRVVKVISAKLTRKIVLPRARLVDGECSHGVNTVVTSAARIKFSLPLTSLM